MSWPWPPGTMVVYVGAPSRAPIERKRKWWFIGKPLKKDEYFTIRSCHEDATFDNGDGPFPEPAVKLQETCAMYSTTHTDYPIPRACFRLAEGGACESERARAMQPITTHEKANK